MGRSKLKKTVLYSMIILGCFGMGLAGYKTYGYYTHSESATIAIQSASEEDIIRSYTFEPLTITSIESTVSGSVYESVYSSVYNIRQTVTFDDIWEDDLEFEIIVDNHDISIEEITSTGLEFTLDDQRIFGTIPKVEERYNPDELSITFNMEYNDKDFKDNSINYIFKILGGYITKSITRTIY